MAHEVRGITTAWCLNTLSVRDGLGSLLISSDVPELTLSYHVEANATVQSDTPPAHSLGSLQLLASGDWVSGSVPVLEVMSRAAGVLETPAGDLVGPAGATVLPGVRLPAECFRDHAYLLSDAVCASRVEYAEGLVGATPRRLIGAVSLSASWSSFASLVPDVGSRGGP